MIATLFYALGVIHAVPAVAGLSATRLANLYGIERGQATLLTLLEHRAVLFALVAGACVYAANTPEVQWAVWIAAVLSMGSFIAIATGHGQLRGPLFKIVAVDAVGLVVAAALATQL